MLPQKLVKEIQPDNRKELLSAFKELPEIQKQLVSRYYSSKITIKALAEEFDLPYAKTRWHLARARHFLKKASNMEYRTL